METKNLLDHQHQKFQTLHFFRLQFSTSSLISHSIIFFLGLALGVIDRYSISSHPLFFDQPINSGSRLLDPQSLLPPAKAAPLSFQDGMGKGKARIEFKDWLQPSFVMHNITDEELLWRASMVPKVTEYPYRRVPKVAFLFLTRGPLPLAPLWERFFKAHDGKYSIYVHTHPSYKGSLPSNSVFYGRRIPSKEVSWGKLSVLEAERRLLANALLDFSNQRFVLLSESCIPLFPFNTIYGYLLNSTLSFVNLVDDPSKDGRGRYSKRLQPVIRKSQWRKGSQWFDMDRKLAIEVVSDRKYFQAFKCCRRRCYPDEHYIPTLLNIEFGGWSANRSVTWVKFPQKAAHPFKFLRYNVTADSLRNIRDGSKCMYNGQVTSICYLFARKFVPDALWRLMKYAPKTLGF